MSQMTPAQIFTERDNSAFKDGAVLGTPQDPNGILLREGETVSLKIPRQWEATITYGEDLITLARSEDEAVVTALSGTGGGLAAIVSESGDRLITREYRIYVEATSNPWSYSLNDFFLVLEIDAAGDTVMATTNIFDGFLYNGEPPLTVPNLQLSHTLGRALLSGSRISTVTETHLGNGNYRFAASAASLPESATNEAFQFNVAVTDGTNISPGRAFIVEVRLAEAGGGGGPTDPTDPDPEPETNPFSIAPSPAAWQRTFTLSGIDVPRSAQVTLTDGFLYNGGPLPDNVQYSATPSSTSISIFDWHIAPVTSTLHHLLQLTNMRTNSLEAGRSVSQTLQITVTSADGEHSLTRSLGIIVRNPGSAVVNPFSFPPSPVPFTRTFTLPDIDTSTSGAITLSDGFRYLGGPVPANVFFTVEPPSSSVPIFDWFLGPPGSIGAHTLSLTNIRTNSNTFGASRTQTLTVTASDGTHSLSLQLGITVVNPSAPPDPPDPQPNQDLTGGGAYFRAVDVSTIGGSASFSLAINTLSWNDPSASVPVSQSWNPADYQFIGFPGSNNIAGFNYSINAQTGRISFTSVRVTGSASNLGGGQSTHQMALTIRRRSDQSQVIIPISIRVRNPQASATNPFSASNTFYAIQITTPGINQFTSSTQSFSLSLPGGFLYNGGAPPSSVTYSISPSSVSVPYFTYTQFPARTITITGARTFSNTPGFARQQNLAVTAFDGTFSFTRNLQVIVFNPFS